MVSPEDTEADTLDVNGHTVHQSGTAKFTDRELWKCRKCGKTGTDSTVFEKIECK